MNGLDPPEGLRFRLMTAAAGSNDAEIVLLFVGPDQDWVELHAEPVDLLRYLATAMQADAGTAMHAEGERLAYSISEAQDHLGGVHQSTVYELIAQGKIKARKLGRRTIIERAELQRFIDSLPFAGKRSTARSAL